MTETTLRVRYAETDQMGVVYHANYFAWFEESRTQYFESLGVSYIDLEKDGFFFPLLECTCRFHSPARYPDRLRICARLQALKGIKIIVGYEVRREDEGALLAEGSTTHVFTDHNMRPVNMPRMRPELWEILQNHLAQ